MCTASKIKCISSASKVSICVRIVFQFRQQQCEWHDRAVDSIWCFKTRELFEALMLWYWTIPPRSKPHAPMVFTHHFYLRFLLRVTQQSRVRARASAHSQFVLTLIIVFHVFFPFFRWLSAIVPNKHTIVYIYHTLNHIFAFHFLFEVGCHCVPFFPRIYGLFASF